MAEARVVKFYTEGDYIKSCLRDDKPPPDRMWLGSHMTHFCMRNCGLGRILPQYAVKWSQQCHQRWTSVASTFDCCIF